MDLEPLFIKQKELRDHISVECEEVDALVDERILALSVEIGELANETRCFKYWSKKPPSERSLILEEYVDGLHFIVELGIDIEYEYEVWILESWKEESLTKQFNALYRAVTMFGDERPNAREGFYCEIFSYFLGLGEMLGFTWSEIEQAYMDKNKVNHERQESGY